jgi:pimeloyl-ACP methyl ester carboxylesterase
MNLYFETHGAGEPLILIPGFASGLWTWYCQIEELSKHFRVIVFDPRGVGKSRIENSAETANLSMVTFVEDVLRILDELKIMRANVLGVSFGGFVAQELVLRFSERVDKLILACTTMGGANHIKPDIEILRSFTSDPNLTPGERVRKFFRPAFTERFSREHRDEVEKVCRLRESNEVAEVVYLAQLRAAFSFNSENEIGAIEKETLVLTGDADNIVPMRNSVNLAEKLPHAALKIIENGSHMFFVENADEFNRIVTEFVRGSSFAGFND